MNHQRKSFPGHSVQNMRYAFRAAPPTEAFSVVGDVGGVLGGCGVVSRFRGIGQRTVEDCGFDGSAFPAINLRLDIDPKRRVVVGFAINEGMRGVVGEMAVQDLPALGISKNAGFSN